MCFKATWTSRVVMVLLLRCSTALIKAIASMALILDSYMVAMTGMQSSDTCVPISLVCDREASAEQGSSWLDGDGDDWSCFLKTAFVLPMSMSLLMLESEKRAFSLAIFLNPFLSSRGCWQGRFDAAFLISSCGGGGGGCNDCLLLLTSWLASVVEDEAVSLIPSNALFCFFSKLSVESRGSFVLLGSWNNGDNDDNENFLGFWFGWINWMRASRPPEGWCEEEEEAVVSVTVVTTAFMV